MQLRYKTIDHRYYELNEEETQAVKDYLKAKIGSRELGKALKVSHQTALSAIAVIARQWIHEGKISFSQ